MNKTEYKLYNDVEHYHWWFRARREALKEILSNINDISKKSVLDVGCGTGGNLNLLFRSFKIRDGIDNNPDAIYYAEKKSNGKVLQHDANAISEIESRYDLVSFLDVLYHKNIINYVKILKDTLGILNKGGYILIADGAFDILSGQHSVHVEGARRFKKKELIVELEKIGYEVITSRYWGVLLFFLIFFKRRIFEKLSKSSASSNIEKLQPLKNNLIYLLVSWERRFMKYFSMPFGSSIFVLARKI